MNSFLSGGVPIRLQAVEPPGAGPFPAVVLLHGAGGSVGFWFDRLAPFAAQLGVALYAIHYFDRTGTQRADPATILDGYHVPLWLATVADALEAVATRAGVDERRLALLGISLGAFLALAHAAGRTGKRVRAIVEISGGLAEPYRAGASATFPPTLIVHGERDTVVPASEARALDELLTRLAIAHRLELLPAEGHWFSPAAQMRILKVMADFLGKHL